MKRTYSGVYVPASTPILPNETVDEKAYRQHVRFMAKNGIDGFFACGTLGETMQLTQEERNNAIRIAADEGKGKIKVLAGVMDTSTKRVIENAKFAESVGADAIVITPVFYDRHTSQDEIIRLFEDVSKATNIDILAYNIPTFTMETIQPKTVYELAQIDRVKGYKDSGGVFNNTLKVLNEMKDRKDFAILSGTPNQYVPSAFVGCDGVVPSMGNVFPKMFANGYQACVEMNVPKMQAFHEFVLAAGKVYGASKNGTAAVKYAVATLGYMDARILRPQDGVTRQEAAVLNAQMEICTKMARKAKGVSKL